MLHVCIKSLSDVSGELKGDQGRLWELQGISGSTGFKVFDGRNGGFMVG